MRLPRRVPWASLAELDQVCNWIYADDSDTDAKISAVNRLSAWRTITPLPHALEATLSILTSVLLDEQYTSLLPRQQHSSRNDGPSGIPTVWSSLTLSVRQSYATAIVRLVNGLVDPLQLGTYARSIASIAAQIGLPQWLVELRHAATHEDLPSLELLRAGSKEALRWLLHNYFLPTLSASNVGQSTPTAHLSPIAPLLKQYKSLMKTVSRDASLKAQYKDDLSKALRSIERWVAEAKVASSAVIFSGWGASEGDGEDENERWALERLCDALLERGGLVPVSSKKRLSSKPSSLPALPLNLIAVWSPLLTALKATHPSLPSILVPAIVDALLCRPTAPRKDDLSKKDLSYELCLAAWASWCVDQWEAVTLDVQSENGSMLKREELVVNLVSVPGAQADELDLKKGARALLSLLTHSNPALEDISTSLLSNAQSGTQSPPKDSWEEGEMRIMEERLNLLLSYNSTSSALENTPVSAAMHADSINSSPLIKDQEENMPKGWSKVPVRSWKPCPIGVFAG